MTSKGRDQIGEVLRLPDIKYYVLNCRPTNVGLEHSAAFPPPGAARVLRVGIKTLRHAIFACVAVVVGTQLVRWRIRWFA